MLLIGVAQAQLWPAILHHDKLIISWPGLSANALYAVAVLAPQNWRCNAPKLLWSSRLPTPIRSHHQLNMKLSNVQISDSQAFDRENKVINIHSDIFCCIVPNGGGGAKPKSGGAIAPLLQSRTATVYTAAVSAYRPPSTSTTKTTTTRTTTTTTTTAPVQNGVVEHVYDWCRVPVSQCWRHYATRSQQSCLDGDVKQRPASEPGRVQEDPQDAAEREGGFVYLEIVEANQSESDQHWVQHSAQVGIARFLAIVFRFLVQVFLSFKGFQRLFIAISVQRRLDKKVGLQPITIDSFRDTTQEEHPIHRAL